MSDSDAIKFGPDQRDVVWTDQQLMTTRDYLLKAQ